MMFCCVGAGASRVHRQFCDYERKHRVSVVTGHMNRLRLPKVYAMRNKGSFTIKGGGFLACGLRLNDRPSIASALPNN